MENAQFEELLKKLNPQQRLAVETIEGPVMVIAGPGTGKTQTLTLRIANILLKTQINPENILALTFTESAVQEMRKRLVSMIGTPAYRVSIHTFHGFCHMLIQNNPEDFKQLMSAQNITDLEQIQIMEEIFQNTELENIKPFVDPLYYVRPALSSIDELKKEGITSKEFKKATEEEENEFKKIDDLYYEKGKYKGRMKGKYQKMEKSIKKNKDLVKIYQAYEKQLRERKLFDFNDMLLFVIRALQQDEELLLRIQEQYHYFLIDEHQDTNAAQNKIVELLASFFENPNLFVVGDEKQAIFRFQGASLENFLYFKNLYPEALLINLRKNYRSNQAILEAATSLISNNQQTETIFKEQLKLESATDLPDEKVKIIEAGTNDTQYHYIAGDIEEKIKNSTDPSKIAILARKNRDITPFSDIFETKKIPYIFESDQNVTEDINIQKFIMLLRAINDVGNDEMLIKAMHLDFLSIAPLDIYKLRRKSVIDDESMWELLANKKYEDIELRTKNEVKELVEKMVVWKKRAENEPMDGIFIDVLNESDLLTTIMNKKNGLEILDKFGKLYDDIKIQLSRHPNWSLHDFLKYIDLLEQHNIIIRKPQTVKREGVRLMTVHKAKGLEFDYVYIINAHDGHWGNIRGGGKFFNLPWDYMKRLDDIKQQGESIEDERRLFYVALTRAKREVTISYAAQDKEGRSLVPSQFIEEISENFRQNVTINTFEKDLDNNKQIIFTPRPRISRRDIEREYTENKEFFSELFAHRGLSVSALNNYIECPWKFFFRNLLTLPEVKNKHQKFGTAVHRGLNRYIIAKQKRDNISKKDLLTFYEDALLDEALSKDDHAELKERGDEVLGGYYEASASKWEKDIQSERQIHGVRIIDGVILNGKLDMIEPIKNSKFARVYDFKTGKPKSRNVIEGKTRNSLGNYKRQLIFYKILLDRYHDGEIFMSEGVIDFVEPNERGIYKKEVFEISDAEVKELEETIRTVAGEIKEFAFWNRRCDNKECEYCKLREVIGREDQFIQ